MRVEIRALTAGDAAEYHALRLRSLRESPESFGSSFDDERDMPLDVVQKRIESVRSPSARVTLGAFVDGSLVGIVSCVQEGRPKTRHKATLLGMFVAPEVRGHGIGRQLIERTIDEARFWPNVERLTLSVVERATAARSLYLSVGFRPFGREVDGFRQDGYSDTVESFALELAEPR